MHRQRVKTRALRLAFDAGGASVFATRCPRVFQWWAAGRWTLLWMRRGLVAVRRRRADSAFQWWAVRGTQRTHAVVKQSTVQGAHAPSWAAFYRPSRMGGRTGLFTCDAPCRVYCRSRPGARRLGCLGSAPQALPRPARTRAALSAGCAAGERCRCTWIFCVCSHACRPD